MSDPTPTSPAPTIHEQATALLAELDDLLVEPRFDDEQIGLAPERFKQIRDVLAAAQAWRPWAVQALVVPDALLDANVSDDLLRSFIQQHVRHALRRHRIIDEMDAQSGLLDNEAIAALKLRSLAWTDAEADEVQAWLSSTPEPGKDFGQTMPRCLAKIVYPRGYALDGPHLIVPASPAPPVVDDRQLALLPGEPAAVPD